MALAKKCTEIFNRNLQLVRIQSAWFNYLLLHPARR